MEKFNKKDFLDALKNDKEFSKEVWCLLLKAGNTISQDCFNLINKQSVNDKLSKFAYIGNTEKTSSDKPEDFIKDEKGKTLK